jgi:hypothetical protein
MDNDGLQGTPRAPLRGGTEEEVEVAVPGGDGPYGFSLIGE